jgi:hypothetical protein
VNYNVCNKQMKTNLILLSIVAVLSAVLVISNYDNFSQRDNFEAAGLVYNKPPEWFNKVKYDPNQWIVTYYPQQLAKPECMHYRGDPEKLNYMSSAYRFWRM